MDISPKDLNKLFQHGIRIQEQDNITGHCRTILKLDPLHFSGNREGNHFSFWRYMQWAGIFYPVFSGQIDPSDPLAPIPLKAKLNPVGRLGILVVICLIAFSLLPHSIPNLPDFISKIPLRRTIILSAYFLVATLLIQQIYRFIKKKALGDIAELIKKANHEK